jgi:membrane-associated phospholipid phosphatase
MNSESKDDWKRIGLFLLACSLFWSFLGYFLAKYGYHGAFKALNPYHNSVTDYSSLYFFTHLGDGLILPGILILWVGRKDPALALSGIISVLLTGVVVQLLKTMVFGDWDRPPVIFADDPMVQIFHPHPHRHHSFPSGQSASMMSGGLAFAIYLGRKRRWLALAVGLFSGMLCYTRPVLGVHFQGDVLVGGLIGALLGAVIIMGIYPRIEYLMEKISSKSMARFKTIAMILAAALILGQFYNQIFIKL